MTDIVYLVSTLCYYKSFSNGENYVIHQLSKHTQRVVLKQPRVYLQLFYQTFIRCCRALLMILCKCQKCRRGEKAAKQRRVFNSTSPDSPQRQKRAPSLFPGKHLSYSHSLLSPDASPFRRATYSLITLLIAMWSHCINQTDEKINASGTIFQSTISTAQHHADLS